MAEQIGTPALAVREREHGHREHSDDTADAELDLAPVELTLLARLAVDLDEHVLALPAAFRLPAGDILAYAGVTYVEALLD